MGKNMKRWIPISRPVITDAEKTAVLAVLDSGHLAQGPRTAEFEERFAQLCGVKHAVATSSGTSALHLALLAQSIGPGDEVITTPFTFIATTNAILFTGAIPVFVDIEEDTFNINPALIESAITPRTKAILPVHLYGQTCDMGRIQAIAQKYDLKVIEDACQSVLATYKGQLAGSFGMGVFSFYATKNLSTGEGGMITTNNDNIAEKCRMIRQHGMKRRYYHEMLGYNFRMTDIQAAMGIVQLERLETLTCRRRANAAYLTEHLQSVVTPKTQDGYGHAWHQYTIRVNGKLDQTTAVEKLKEAGIETGIYYPLPVHKQKSVMQVIGDVTMPVAEQAARQVLSLPVHPQLSQDDLETIVAEVNRL
jgi:perosamine synthetase